MPSPTPMQHPRIRLVLPIRRQEARPGSAQTAGRWDTSRPTKGLYIDAILKPYLIKAPQSQIPGVFRTWVHMSAWNETCHMAALIYPVTQWQLLVEVYPYGG